MKFNTSDECGQCRTSVPVHVSNCSVAQSLGKMSCDVHQEELSKLPRDVTPFIEGLISRTLALASQTSAKIN